MNSNLDTEPAYPRPAVDPGQRFQSRLLAAGRAGVLPGLPAGHGFGFQSGSSLHEAPGQARKAALRDLGSIGGVALAYFVGARIGLSLMVPGVKVSLVWPPAGIALAAVLLLGYRVWPGVLLGLVLANFPYFGWVAHAPPIAATLGVGLGNSAAAVAGGWLARRFAGGRAAFGHPQKAMRFIGFAVATGAAISATVGVISLSLAGCLAWSRFANSWFVWWLADLGGAIVLTPFFLVWSTNRPPALGWRRVSEAAGLAALLAAICVVLFGGWFTPRTEGAPLALLLVPALVWPALRFGQRGTTAAVLVVASIAIWGTFHDSGPFNVQNRANALVLAEEFIAVIAVMALVLAADVAQRQKSDAGLHISEERYRTLFENNPQPVWVFDYDTLGFLAVNNAAIQLYGHSREEFLSMSIRDFLPPEEVPPLLEAISLARQGVKTSARRRHWRKDGAILNVELAWRNLVFDGRRAALVLSTDLTERERAEQRVAAFSNLGCRLSAANTPQQAAQIITDIADTLFGWDACAFDLCSPNQKRLRPVLRIDRKGGQGVEAGEAGFGTAGFPPHAQEVLKRGAQLVRLEEPTATLMSVPVRNGERGLGILSIKSYRPNAYTEEDLRTLHALADHCGGALERIRTEAALSESNERLRLALTAGKMGTWIFELGGHPQIVGSPELEAVFGLKPGEFGETEKAALELIHPADHELVRHAIAQAVADQDEHEFEFRFLPRNRPVGWMLVRGRAHKDDRGRPVRLAGIGIDITELKQAEGEILRLNAELEERVSRRTAQLEAINKELEAFCYSVSHDLRAPLRSIRGFSEVLLDRYAASLDARGQEFLRRSCESSKHMDGLIDDLLRLSRVGRAELAWQAVDLSALAAAVAAELSKAEPKRNVDWVIAPRLQARGDERLLRIVLENLLRNAWKFTSKQSRPRIELGATAEPEPAFFVRDNGAGFDMEFAGKLFGVFQRLHSASEFPGTGVGLATVRRIVNRHGGRVWANGALNQGAVFYFTLPANRGA
jgi:PAS domain S-box-containing protein